MSPAPSWFVPSLTTVLSFPEKKDKTSYSKGKEKQNWSMRVKWETLQETGDVCRPWRVERSDSSLGVWWMSWRGELAEDMGALWPAHCSRVDVAVHWRSNPASALCCHLPEHYRSKGSSVLSLKIHDNWRTRGGSKGYGVMGCTLSRLQHIKRPSL